MTARRVGLATLIAALAVPAAASASTFTQEGLPYTTDNDPYGVLTADFNRDGLVDVATINGTGSTMSVFLRQPTGGFAQEAGSPFRTGGGPNFGAVADFNADGLPDAAVSNYVDGTVSVLLRQSGGGFAAEGSPLPVFQGFTTSVVSADFNGDRRPDLAATSEAGFVSIYLRQASGGFTLATNPGANQSARNLSAGDLDGDGDQDLAIANDGPGGVTVLYNNGSANFSQGSTFTATGTRAFQTAIADFNRDGRNDIAVSHLTNSTVAVLSRNASNTGFDAPVSVPVGEGAIGLAVADFDTNGTPDLAVASNSAGTVTILSGGTVPEPSLPFTRAYGLTTADFNGDRKPDLAVSQDGPPKSLSVLLNTTAVAPPPVQTPTPTPSATPSPTPVAGVRVNGAEKSGTIKVKRPGTNNFVDVSGTESLPVGTQVDARKGKVTLTAAGSGGVADFYDGIFKISQTKGSKPLTTLTLTEQLSCPKAKKSASASAKKKSRKLWGDGKGNFRTKGRYSAATIRGTKWLVTDRCDSTTTFVAQGVVTVRDEVKKKNVIVRKGKKYVARAKR